MRKNWNKKKLVIAKIYKRCNLTTTGETKAGEKSKEEELENIGYKLKRRQKKTQKDNNNGNSNSDNNYNNNYDNFNGGKNEKQAKQV